MTMMIFIPVPLPLTDQSTYTITVKPALVTTCLQRPHLLFPLKMVSH